MVLHQERLQHPGGMASVLVSGWCLVGVHSAVSQRQSQVDHVLGAY